MELQVAISGQLCADSEMRIKSALKGIGCMLPSDTYIMAHVKFERQTYSVSFRAGCFDAVFAAHASSKSLDRLITSLESNLYKQIREWKEARLEEEKQVLILDDNPLIHLLLKKLLASSTVKVTSASTIAEARSLMEENNFSLLFLDYDLGPEKGFELLKTTKENTKSTTTLPFILFSSYGPFSDIPKYSDGFELLGQIPKDLDYHDLARYVNHYVAA